MKHRLTFFSDAVYAIIITLMVLDLQTPQSSGWHGWWYLLPALGGYAVTFAILLVIWLTHHELFSRVHEINRTMFWWNGGCLFFASLIPLTLRDIIEHPHERVAYIVYQIVGWSAMICMAGFRLSASAAHGDDPDWQEWFHKRNQVALFGTLQACISIGLTFVYLPAAIAFFLAMLIALVLSVDIHHESA